MFQKPEITLWHSRSIGFYLSLNRPGEDSVFTDELSPRTVEVVRQLLYWKELQVVRTICDQDGLALVLSFAGHNRYRIADLRRNYHRQQRLQEGGL